MIQPNSFPHGSITQICGRALILPGDDIDTDRIIPARFLKCVSFEALGDKVFEDDRLERGGSHPFDLPAHKGASILVVNDNFGCGSSREHAPQALMRWGIRALIGQGFAEIFYGNCLALGIPCATTDRAQNEAIQKAVRVDPSQSWSLNLQTEKLVSADTSFKIDIQPGHRERLTTGRWDVISQLLAEEEALTNTAKGLPYLKNFVK